MYSLTNPNPNLKGYTMKTVTGYCIVQTEAVNANTWAVARLYDGARKTPAGYIVGKYEILADNLTESEAGALLDFAGAVVAAHV